MSILCTAKNGMYMLCLIYGALLHTLKIQYAVGNNVVGGFIGAGQKFVLYPLLLVVIKASVHRTILLPPFYMIYFL